MRIWVRAVIDERCGYCGHEIPAGQPMLTYPVGGRSLKRCEPCAKEKPPPDLPPLDEPQAVQVPVTMRPTRVGSVADLAKDWKLRQGNDR